MKNLALIVCLLVSTLSFAQTKYNQWSASLSIGSHDGLFPTKTYTRVYQIHHIGANGRYMINKKFGLMLDVGYDYMDFYDNPINTNYWRTSIQGVINAGNVLCFDTWTQRIGLLFHAGAGMSHMWLKKELRVGGEDPLFSEVDDMINYTFGASPQVRLTDMISLNADLSLTLHSRQSNTWDFKEKNINEQFNGYLLNTTIGVTISLGEHSKHIDWSPSDCRKSSVVIDSSKHEDLVPRLDSLEYKMEDDDNDGVPNVQDLELDTEEGATVDEFGRTFVDSDGDGIPDEKDMCPNAPGLYADNGCPDSDNDGIDDFKDLCPYVAGLHENTGCPPIEEEVKEILTKALEGVQFQSGKDVLLPSSFSVLDAVVTVMKDHSEYGLEISGHTDDVGDDAANLKLSKDRAQSVMNYLVGKGVEAGRLHPEGYGETMPKASNDTPAGQAQNRRVEFNIVFE